MEKYLRANEINSAGSVKKKNQIKSPKAKKRQRVDIDTLMID